MVIVIAWMAGLLGAYVGVQLATRDDGPPRQPSTLGLVRVEPRAEPYPRLDVYTVASAVNPSVVSIQATTPRGGVVGSAAGTGVVLTADGEIITNAHVVEGATTVNVRLVGETEPRPAAVVATDPARDLALLRVEASGLSPATFAAAGDVRLGDEVIAIGYALDLEGDPTVTAGVVSAVDRSAADVDSALKGLIQTDAPISSGNSGGPLVNALGQVIGITTFVALPQLGSTANSLGFAISNAELFPTIERLRATAAGEAIATGYLGVGLADRLDGGLGALVNSLVAGSPADSVGIRVGDAVVEVAGQPIAGQAALVAVIRDYAPGDEVSIRLMRAGVAIEVSVRLAERPAD